MKKTAKAIIFPLLKRVLSVSAPGYSGLTMYWLIVIGVILMAGYLVGGLIPKRFPDLSQKTPVRVSPRSYNDTRNALQLRRAVDAPQRRTADTVAPTKTPTPVPNP